MAHTDTQTEHGRTSRRAGALLVVALVAAGCAVMLSSSHTVSTPGTFVDRALGAPSPTPRSSGGSRREHARGRPRAASTRAPARQTIALASQSAGSGDWQRYGSGVTRTTSFGRESILFGINRAEQFLTVEPPVRERAHGRWQLDATHGTPHVDRRRRRELHARRAARRLPHPPGRDPRPRRSRRHAGRPRAGRSTATPPAGRSACGSTTGRCRSRT